MIIQRFNCDYITFDENKKVLVVTRKNGETNEFTDKELSLYFKAHSNSPEKYISEIVSSVIQDWGINETTLSLLRKM